jgi:hypothetical protein
MTHKPSIYRSPSKRAAPSNPLIISVRWAGLAFWSMVTVVAALVLGAVYWLLTHPVSP